MNKIDKNISADKDTDWHLDEVGLIGCLLAYQDPVLYRAAAAIINPEHFFDPFHGRIFELMGKGFDAGLANWPWSHWLLVQLRDDAALRELNWPASAMMARYISQASCPPIGVEGAARQIRHNCLSVRLEEAVEDGDTASAETIAAEMERLSRAHLATNEGLVPLAGAAHRVLDNLSAAYQAGGVVNDFATSGSLELDRVIGGWRRGRFYVLAGRPSMGKTTTGLSWLLRTAAKGEGVMFFSLEMTKEELTEIALCDIAYDRRKRIEYRDLSTSAITAPGFELKYDALFGASQKLANIPFAISDKAGQTLAEIRSQAQQYAQRLASDGKRLSVICIDHLNLIRASDRYSGSKTAETEEVSAGLKQLAKELQCAVLCLCQLNRAVEGREEKRPNLSDLRWSGAIEQDADVVMFVYREAYYLERSKHDDMAEENERLSRLEQVRNKLEVVFGKNRGGPCPALEFYADMGCGVVRDLEALR